MKKLSQLLLTVTMTLVCVATGDAQDWAKNLNSGSVDFLRNRALVQPLLPAPVQPTPARPTLEQINSGLNRISPGVMQGLLDRPNILPRNDRPLTPSELGIPEIKIHGEDPRRPLPGNLHPNPLPPHHPHPTFPGQPQPGHQHPGHGPVINLNIPVPGFLQPHMPNFQGGVINPVFVTPPHVTGVNQYGGINTGDARVHGSVNQNWRDASRGNGTLQNVSQPVYDQFGNVVGYRQGQVWINSATGQQHGNLQTLTPNGAGGVHESVEMYSTAGGNIQPMSGQ